MNKKRIIEKMLRFMAQCILWKYHPTVIGVTGSVGKTTTKDAIAYALSGEFFVRSSVKNYNNEIGVPLTILGVDTSPGRSLKKWLGLGLDWLRCMVLKVEYPEVLVLEMAVDRKGDMRYLMSIVQPQISVVTEVSLSHIEYFGSVKAIANEKMQILRDLGEDGYAIVNEDSSYTRTMKKRTKASALGYGFGESSDLRAINEFLAQGEDGAYGMHLKIEYQGKVVPVRLDHIVARHHIYAILAAFAVGSCMKMNLIEIGQKMVNFSLPPGRLQILPGIRESWILDDSYNASSPISVHGAIETLGMIKSRRRIVALGDMLELGDEEEVAHRGLAKDIMKQRINDVVLVGPRMRSLAHELEKRKYSKEHIFIFSDPMQAGKKLHSMMRQGDHVLVKGSQGSRMEKAAEMILREGIDAKKVLCRQDDRWREIPFKKL